MEIVPAGFDLMGVRPASPLDYELTARTLELAERATPPKTAAAYEAHAKRFRQWCAETGRTYYPVTTETLTNYIGHLVDAGVAPPSIGQAIAAIRTAHRRGGDEPPVITETARDILKAHDRRRAENGEYVKRSNAVVTDILRKLVAATNQDPDSLAGKRDRLIVTLGVNLMGRRSELANLNLGDVRETDEGLLVYVAFSKTDRRGDGEQVAVVKAGDENLCPKVAYLAWRESLAVCEVTTGRVFRKVDRWNHPGSALTPESINRIVKGLATRAGLPEADKYTAHGLRAGGATVAAQNGAPRAYIARQGRWSEKSNQVDTYIRTVDIWKDHPLQGAF